MIAVRFRIRFRGRHRVGVHEATFNLSVKRNDAEQKPECIYLKLKRASEVNLATVYMVD